jgi:hypothetical protein
VLSLPAVSPDSFGRQAFGQVEELGKTLDEIGQKVQAQQDKLDLAHLASEYAVGLDAVTAKAGQEVESAKRSELFGRETESLQSSVLKTRPDASEAVKKAFRIHAVGEHARAYLDASHQAQVLRTNRAVADFANTENNLTERAALEVDPTKAAQHLALLGELRTGMVSGGVLSAVEAQKRQESSQHRYWSIYAQHRPEALLDLVNHPMEGGENIAGMDPEKRNVYVNLAINTLHAQQTGEHEAQVKADKAMKEKQEAQKARLTADLLDGKPVQGEIGPLTRARKLDPDKVSSLLELQAKLAQVPDMSKWQRGLATRIESELSRMAYDNTPFNPAIYEGLQADFVQGHLLKDEFVHLSGVARGIQSHKENTSQTPRNTSITQAASNLETVMESANKLTGFSAVGNQATAAAKEYFYRRVAQEPKANPWDIMHDAETRFKPIVEKQQGISKIDQMLLDDAKIAANAQLGIVSKAAIPQDDRGRKIVNDALKALPPPPEPGFFERLFQKKQTSAKPRKTPGVMGE